MTRPSSRRPTCDRAALALTTALLALAAACESGGSTAASGECVSNSDCTGGKVCEGSGASAQCACAANASTICKDGNVYGVDSCGVTASAPSTVCSAGQTCETVGGGAVCKSQVCTSKAGKGCVGDAIYWVDSCGNSETLSSYCPAGQVCVVGEGLTATCEAPPCTSNTDCPDAKHCVDGACVDDVCSPGETRCVDVSAREICNGEGSGFEPTDACGDGATCADGVCACAPKVRKACDGNDIRWFDSCDKAGELVEGCPNGSECTDVSGEPACVVPPCTSSATCQPNQFCKDGACVADVCTAGAHQCVGDDAVETCADDGSGFVPSGQCLGGKVCQGGLCKCVSKAGKGCWGGGVYWVDSCGEHETLSTYCLTPKKCHTTTGFDATCEVPPCGSSADCQANQYCKASVCVADVCTPGSKACSGSGAITTCNAEGSGYEPTGTCADGKVCSGGSCVCQPKARLGCNNTDIYWFDSCGAVGTLSSYCTSPKECVGDGAGGVTCDIPACVADGDCPGGMYCDSGKCIDNVCTVGATRCANADFAVELCDGKGWSVAETCSGGQVCVAGDCACVPKASKVCADGDVHWVDSCGTVGAVATSCASGTTCTPSASGELVCAKPPCTSNAGCAGNQYCSAGACLPDLCTAGNRRCAAGDAAQVETCNAAGSAWEITQACPAGAACTATATSASCVCTPATGVTCHLGALYEIDSCGKVGKLSSYCTAPQKCLSLADGSAACGVPACATDEGCPKGQYCSSGTCVPRVCTPGTRQCASNSIQLCNANGSAWELSETCSNGAQCQSSGSSVACKCTPNAALGCYATDIYHLDSCGNVGTLQSYCTAPEVCLDDGSGTPTCGLNPTCASAADCYVGQLCNAEGACVPKVCTPGQRRCDGLTVLRCDDAGGAWEEADTCEGGEVCDSSSGVPSCRCVPKVAQMCAGNDDIYWADSCGNPGGLVQYCTAPAACQALASGPACVTAAQATCPTCAGKTVCAKELDPPACVSSVADADSPYWETSCTLTHQLAHPTTLPADCRCYDNRSPSSGIPACVAVNYLDAGVSFGEGPRVRPLPQAHINGGFVDGANREIVAGVDWSSGSNPDSGLIMAFDMDTGDRRIVSGAHQGASGVTTTGAGPALHNVIDVKRATTGQLYALSVPGSSLDTEVVRVDPSTGDRTVVWRSGDGAYGQCASGDGSRRLRVWGEAFALDDANNIYLAFGGAGFTSEGVGVIRLTPDGKHCEVVSRSGAGELNEFYGEDVGEGYPIDRGRYISFTFHDGALYAMHEAWLSLVRIDPLTGDRTVVSSASTSMGVVGSGPVNYGGIGMRWLVWDGPRGHMWTAGVLNVRSITAVDLESGDRVQAHCGAVNADVPWRSLCLTAVTDVCCQNWGGTWLDPMNGDLIIGQENVSLVRIDVYNGNAMRLSL